MSTATPANFLVWTTAQAGHVNPGLPIVRRLVERGHHVRWYTGSEYRAAIEATGATFEPMISAVDPGEHPMNERYPQRLALEGLAGLKFDLKHLFLDEVPAQIDDVRRLLAAHPADALLVDVATLGAPMLAALGGPPWAAYGVSVLTMGGPDVAPFGTALPPGNSLGHQIRNRLLAAAAERIIFRDVVRHDRGIRRKLGVPQRTGPFLESTISPYLYLQPATPAFEYPRRNLPETVHWIGPLLPEAGEHPLPGWWPELAGALPIVLVTQGTVATDDGDLIRPTLAALADEPVLVVVAGANGLAPADIPANARVEQFVPFASLLPKTSVMVTNGGYGGVQFALANGVPLVVAGTTEEKPEIAARVEWAGAGLRIRTKTPTPEQMRVAVRRVLDEPAYRSGAQRVARDYARHDAPAEAAALLELLAATGRRVTRDAVVGRIGPHQSSFTAGASSE
jgi:MGT family glycosyltransferase